MSSPAFLPLSDPYGESSYRPRFSSFSFWSIFFLFALLPLIALILLESEPQSIKDRLVHTIEQSQPGRGQSVVEQIDSGLLELEDVILELPDKRLLDAALPIDSQAHWLFGTVAVLFFALPLSLQLFSQEVNPAVVVLCGIFTMTVGIMFLFLIQYFARAGAAGEMNATGAVAVILAVIGFAYYAAFSPDTGLLASLFGYIVGIGLCEEFCKAVPLLFFYHYYREKWQYGLLAGIAAGMGFGLAEAVHYSVDFYHGMAGPPIYWVRFFSCVALHSIWTASCGVATYRSRIRSRNLEEIYQYVFVVAEILFVPVVLHGLYDTFLKAHWDILALLVACLSIVWLNYQMRRAEAESACGSADPKDALPIQKDRPTKVWRHSM